jgi:hypothetical protein
MPKAGKPARKRLRDALREERLSGLFLFFMTNPPMNDTCNAREIDTLFYYTEYPLAEIITLYS